MIGERVFVKQFNETGKYVEGTYFCHNSGRTVYVVELDKSKNRVEVFVDDVRELTREELDAVIWVEEGNEPEEPAAPRTPRGKGMCLACENSGCGVCFEHARKAFLAHRKKNEDRENVQMLIAIATALQSAPGGEGRWQLGEDVMKAVHTFTLHHPETRGKPDEDLYETMLAAAKLAGLS